jgi:hypothetical protein
MPSTYNIWSKLERMCLILKCIINKTLLVGLVLTITKNVILCYVKITHNNCHTNMKFRNHRKSSHYAMHKAITNVVLSTHGPVTVYVFHHRYFRKQCCQVYMALRCCVHLRICVTSVVWQCLVKYTRGSSLTCRVFVWLECIYKCRPLSLLVALN